MYRKDNGDKIKTTKLINVCQYNRNNGYEEEEEGHIRRK